MLRHFISALFITAIWINIGVAQEEIDPIEFHTFPPELVIKYQKAIGLSETQRNAIKKEVVDGQKRFTELEWDMQQKMEILISKISQEKVDEQAAQTDLKSILALEEQMKLAQLTLLIRIKNTLTSEQQNQLRELRN